MVENLKKMQELKAQIQAQIKLAETLKKLSDNAGLVEETIISPFNFLAKLLLFTFQKQTMLTLD